MYDVQTPLSYSTIPEKMYKWGEEYEITGKELEIVKRFAWIRKMEEEGLSVKGLR